jgi:two-component system OmpR family sensor kinase
VGVSEHAIYCTVTKLLGAMNRAFLSLYLLIVLCVAVVGWGLDKLWQYYSPAPLITAAQQDLLTLIEAALTNDQYNGITGQPQLTEVLPKTMVSRIELLSFDDFATSTYSDALSSGAPLLLYDQYGQQQIYQQLATGDQIIRLTLPHIERPKGSYLYEILLTLFYCSLGLVVFIWVWPLMRDVRKLELHTKHLGHHSLPNPVSVSPASALSHLARAFNQMAERSKELLASHKEITYAVSHELRTPLARMKFALAMVKGKVSQNETINDSLNMHLASLAQDVEEMEALITQLLSYAGYEQESGPLEQKNGDMAFLISELIRRAKASHSANHIDIFLECKMNVTQVNCDWHLMERAIFNLIHNALRFADKKIIITLSQSEKDYQITIEDDGPGIPDDQALRVFESFVRLEVNANAQTRGFGLGLAIVKRVMKWHLGQAFVDKSHALGGAKFTLLWPR